jgi:nicotinamidase-related amidase
MQPVLMVIDIQKDFFSFSEITAQSLNAAIKVINNAISLFRDKGYPIISIQHIDEDDNLKPGNPSFDLPDELQILPEDLHIHKTYQNAFNKTSLADELSKMNANPLILTGFCAEYCVLSTYRGAKDLDFKPILLQGALASDCIENIQFVENISDTISFGALISFLES